jgi:hypothetical protein
MPAPNPQTLIQNSYELRHSPVKRGPENTTYLVSAVHGGSQGYRLCHVHPHALHQVSTVLWLPVVLTSGGEVSVHAGGLGRQASPPRPVTPLKRLESGGSAPRHRDGNERPASRRTHHTPLRPQFHAATLSARPQGVGGRGGCHVATVDRAAGGCGGQAGSADRHRQQPRTGRMTTPTRS